MKNIGNMKQKEKMSQITSLASTSPSLTSPLTSSSLTTSWMNLIHNE
jgi:hypothetical protein